MRNKIYTLLFVGLVFVSCKTTTPIPQNTTTNNFHSDFSLAFGSGNNQKLKNPFWQAIQNKKPNVWIWEGDAIYSDTENMSVLKKNYDLQKNKTDYQNFIQHIPVIGTWDDHEYGVNDGGAEYPQKVASQKLFLDFLDVPTNDIRRQRKGVYFSKNYNVDGHQIKIILLDTRYFRTALTKNNSGKKRYKPNAYGQGTMLGEAQWKWLQKELNNSTADFNVIMSSIQFLSGEHGFEAWGNMPHEIKRMENIILKSNAKAVFILSGDRHVSEISRKNIGDHLYPLYDFTSSGLTHSYTAFSGEPNQFRITPVIYQKSFGLVKFDVHHHKIRFEMWGEKNKLLQIYDVQF